MAAVVPDLVEDGSLQKIGPRHRPAVDLTLPGLPRLPVADLRVGREQQHVSFSRLAQFERKDETRVVGIALKRQSQFRRRTEPIAIDAPPVVALGGVAPGVVLAEEIVDLPPVFLVDGTTVRQPWSALLAERDRHPLMDRGISNGLSVGRHILSLAIPFTLSRAALVLVLDDAAAPKGMSAMSASMSLVAGSPAA